LYKELTALAEQIIKGTMEKRYVFLTGAPGSGKSHFLVGCFRSRVLADEGVMGAEHSLYIPFNTMVTEIISGFAESHSTRMGLAQYLPVKYLFVDDISRGERTINPDKMEGQMFRDLLLDRWENNRHLICTSNYDPVTLRRMLRTVFGEYVLSRVEGSSMFVKFPDEDFRKVKNDK
jgi:DNA replication protein DnaC